MNNLRGVAPSVNINLKKAEHHGVKGKIYIPMLGPSKLGPFLRGDFGFNA